MYNIVVFSHKISALPYTYMRKAVPGSMKHLYVYCVGLNFASRNNFLIIMIILKMIMTNGKVQTIFTYAFETT